uniref:hypothetical protein n=1 Tax=Zhouia sp. PK063 TaxID=3373602 RepID=UPI0037DC22E9
MMPRGVKSRKVATEGSSTVGAVGQVSKTVSLAADDNTRNATLKATGIILSTATGN